MITAIGSITANPLGLKPAAVECLADQSEPDFIFSGKIQFFWDMAFFSESRVRLTKPFLGKIQLVIHEAVSMIPGISQKYAGLAVFSFAQTAAVLAFYSCRVPSFLYKTCIIYGKHAARGIDLCGQQFLISFQKRPFIKRGTAEELLKRPDILFTREMKSNGLNRSAFQRTQKSTDKGLEKISLWL